MRNGYAGLSSSLLCVTDVILVHCPGCKRAQYATSLGGVESLIEQRYVSDGVSDKRLGAMTIIGLMTSVCVSTTHSSLEHWS
jgi:hypothetical protein